MRCQKVRIPLAQAIPSPSGWDSLHGLSDNLDLRTRLWVNFSDSMRASEMGCGSGRVERVECRARVWASGPGEDGIPVLLGNHDQDCTVLRTKAGFTWVGCVLRC